VQAQQKLQIAPGGKVLADVTTPSLVIEDGALFEGRCAMTREERAPETATPPVPKLVPQKATAR
jgi:cytoskeletal protein CcmA (bactofilin family)